MDILEKAKELGVIISESIQFANVNQTEEEIQSDDKAQALLMELKRVHMSIRQAMSEKQDPKEIDALELEYKTKQEEVNTYDVTKRYFAAQSGFDALMNEINEAIVEGMTGKEKEASSCSSGSCGSCCGGCS